MNFPQYVYGFFLVGRIKEETGVSIRIPPDNENSNIIRIEGSPAGVATARKELEDMVFKMVRQVKRLKPELIDAWENG